MKESTKKIIISGIIVTVTVILAVVAIITALRFRNLKDEPVALNVPQSQPRAYSCEEYQILMNSDGIVRIINSSTNAQPSRTIDLLVNGESLGSFTIPALDAESDAILGGINLPIGDFNWSITGDVFCQGASSGVQHETTLCQKTSFSVSAQAITPTITPVPGVSQTPVPTSIATQTPISTVVPTSSVTNTAVSDSNPTATPQVPPLPDTGITLPTYFGIAVGIIVFAVALVAAF